MPLGLICLVFALVLFVIAAAWNPPPWYPRLVAAGLAFLTVYFLVSGHLLPR